MKRVRVSGLTALASALALAVAAIPVSALTSASVAGAPQTATVLSASSSSPLSAGTLILGTTSSLGFVEWNGQRQEFREANQCRIIQAPGTPELLKLEGIVGSTIGTAGFRNGNIGVYEFDSEGDGASNAAQCFRVDAGSFSSTETLSLNLGADATDGFGAVVASTVAVAAVAQSRNGSVQVTLVRDDGTTQTLPTKQWNGRQSGAAIDVGGPFTGSFTGIQLKAVTGAFSVRGATFDLVSQADGELGCDPDTNSDTVEADGADPAVTVTRLDNADPVEPCVLIPYTLRNADQTVQFLKPLDTQVSAQFILDFVWTVSPANTNWQGSGSLLPETTIDYEQGGAEIPLRWCPDVTTDETGSPTGISNVLTNLAVVDQEETLDSKQFTCIIAQNATVSDGDPDFVTVEQKVYLLGDAAYRFR